MIKELYLPLDEAARVAECSERALLQRGAQGLMPIYVLVDNYEYTNVVDKEGLDPSFHDRLNGRQQVLESSLADYLDDPEASLHIVHYAYCPVKTQWTFLLFPPVKMRDSKLIVMTADLKTAGLLPNDTMSSLSEFVDDPRWPAELDIAILAWQAACHKHGLSDRPRDFIEQWVAEQYPDLPPEALKRVSTIANWNKSTGRKPAT
jgi:hypothetical protein